jgi:hypothetical protein
MGARVAERRAGAGLNRRAVRGGGGSGPTEAGRTKGDGGRRKTTERDEVSVCVLRFFFTLLCFFCEARREPRAVWEWDCGRWEVGIFHEVVG